MSGASNGICIRLLEDTRSVAITTSCPSIDLSPSSDHRKNNSLTVVASVDIINELLQNLSLIRHKDDKTMTVTVPQLMSTIFSSDYNIFNIMCSVIPSSVINSLCKKALDVQSISSFFRYCSLHLSDITVQVDYVEDQDKSNYATYMTERVDDVLQQLRNNLLEWRSLSNINAASNTTIVAFMTASWLSTTQDMGLLNDSVAAIAHKIQNLAVQDVDSGNCDSYTIEMSVRADARLLLDARLSLENAIHHKLSSDSIFSKSDVNTGVASTDDLLMYMILAEMFGIVHIFESCARQFAQYLYDDTRIASAHQKDLNINTNCDGVILSLTSYIHKYDLAQDSLFHSSKAEALLLESRPIPNTVTAVQYQRTPGEQKIEESEDNSSACTITTEPSECIVTAFHSFNAQKDSVESPVRVPPIPQPYPSNLDVSLEALASHRYSYIIDDSISSLSPTIETAYSKPTRSTSPMAVDKRKALRTVKSTVTPTLVDKSIRASTRRTNPTGGLYSRDGHYIGSRSSTPTSSATKAQQYPDSSYLTPQKANGANTKPRTATPSTVRQSVVEKASVQTHVSKGSHLGQHVEQVKQSRLKAVELKAVMARVGYGTPSNTSSTSQLVSNRSSISNRSMSAPPKQSNRQESIFHRMRKQHERDVEPASNDNEVHRLTAEQAVRRANSRVHQRKADLLRMQEQQVQDQRDKEQAKWRDRDNKIAMFLQRQAEKVTNKCLGNDNNSRHRYSSSRVIDPWNVNSPQGMDVGNKLRFEALQSVGLAPLEYDNVRGSQGLSGRSNVYNGTTKFDASGFDFYESHGDDDDGMDMLHLHDMMATAGSQQQQKVIEFKSPTSVAADHSNYQTYGMQQSNSIYLRVNRAWGLVEELAVVNPYVVVDWGSLGRACTDPVIASTCPNYNCYLEFKSPFAIGINMAGVEDESDDGDTVRKSKDAIRYIRLKGKEFAIAAPNVKTYIYSRNETMSDELLGEGEVEVEDLFQLDTCTVRLLDMVGQPNGFLEVSLK